MLFMRFSLRPEKAVKTVRRAIALGLCVCLFTGDTALAAPLPETLSSLPAAPQIPRELGRVESFHAGTRPKTVLFIQDAHDVLDAQKNIAALIHHFVRHAGVRTVYEEGYEGPVPTEALFDKSETREDREKLAYYLLDQLRIGGAEYAHINRREDFRLVGADSLRGHFENVRYYREAALVQQELQNSFDTASRELLNLAARLEMKTLTAFYRLREKQESGAMDLVRYLGGLAGLYREAHADEDLSKRFPLSARILSLQVSQNTGDLQKLETLNPAELSSEIEALEKALTAALGGGEPGRTIVDSLEKIRLLRRFSRFELTAREYDEAKKVLETFRAQALADFLAREGQQTVVLPKRWETGLEAARGFYETALKRDEKIAEAMADFAADERESSAVLVYGGFHAPRVREILKESGMSFAVVSPEVRSIEKRHQDYYRERMADETAAALAGESSRMARPISVFEIETAGNMDARVRQAEELRVLKGILSGLSGDPEAMVSEARHRIVRKPAVSVRRAPRSELRSLESEAPLPSGQPSVNAEERADKIAKKLLKKWYRGKGPNLRDALNDLWGETLKLSPPGTPGYFDAMRAYDAGVLDALAASLEQHKALLDELKALSSDLFIYHAGIETELRTGWGRQTFRKKYGTVMPKVQPREGDPFTPEDLVPVFSELLANIRHVYPYGAMFFYRLDDDPDYIKFIIRDGGAYSVRAAGVKESIMGARYPDESGTIRTHGYHNVIDAVVRRRFGGEIIVEYDHQSERYYSGAWALSPWTLALNRWLQEHAVFPVLGLKFEVIGLPRLESGGSRIKPKQGLKVKLLIPRKKIKAPAQEDPVRSELREAPWDSKEFEMYARDYFQDTLEKQDQRLYHESEGQAKSRYGAVALETQAAADILNMGLRMSYDSRPEDLDVLLGLLEKTFRIERAGRTLRDWIAADSGVTQSWALIKDQVNSGIGGVWGDWERENSEVQPLKVREYFQTLQAVYARLHQRQFTKESLENVLFRLQTLWRGYRRTDIVREWSEEDTGNVAAISGLYAFVDREVPRSHQVRITISNPRSNARTFPYLTAVMDQSLAAAFLEDIRFANDLLKRWPFRFIETRLKVSHKTAAVVSLASAAASLLFGPGAGVFGAALEVLFWGAAAVLWAGVFVVKNKTKIRFELFADMIQEQSGMWDVIPAQEDLEAAGRSELRAVQEPVFKNTMSLYTPYPEAPRTSALSAQEAGAEAARRMGELRPDPRRPVVLTRAVKQGAQSMNLTAVHRPGAVEAIAVRARADAPADEIYYVETAGGSDAALKTVLGYLSGAYPDRTWDVESGAGLLPSGTQDVVMITKRPDEKASVTIPPALWHQLALRGAGTPPADLYHRMTGQTPPAVPKLLMTKFRSRDPQDQDPGRSELRSDDELNALWANQWIDDDQVAMLGKGFETERAEAEGFFGRFFAERLRENPRARFLDLGTGRLFVPKIGAAAAEATEGAEAEFHGIDSAPLSPAHQPAVQNIFYHAMRMEDLGQMFGPESIDGATSSFGIEYAENPGIVADALFKALKPGAQALFLIHHPESVIAESVRLRFWETEVIRSSEVLESLSDYVRDPGPETSERVLEAYRQLRIAEETAAGKEADLIKSILDQMELILIAGEEALPALEEMKRDILNYQKLFRHYLERAAAFGSKGEEGLRKFFELRGFRILEISRFAVKPAEGRAANLIAWKVLLRKPESTPRADRSELRSAEKPAPFREIRTYEDAVSVNDVRVEEALRAGAITSEKAENYKETFRGIRRVSERALQIYADSARAAGLPVFPLQAVWVGGRIQGAPLKQLASPELGRDSDLDLVIGFLDSEGLLPRLGKYESILAAAFIQALAEEKVPGALDYEETQEAAEVSELARKILERYREETESKTRIQLMVRNSWKPLRSREVQGHPLNFPQLLLAETDSKESVRAELQQEASASAETDSKESVRSELRPSADAQGRESIRDLDDPSSRPSADALGHEKQFGTGRVELQQEARAFAVTDSKESVRSELRMFVNDWVRQQFAIAGVAFLDEHIPTDAGVFRPTLSGHVDPLTEYARTYETIRIIDLGSGQGAMVFAFALANDRAEVLGIEYDEALFKDSVKVRDSFFEERRKRIRLEQGDFNDPRFAEEIKKADLLNYWETGSRAESQLILTLAKNMRPGAKFLVTRNSGRFPKEVAASGYFELAQEDPDEGISLFKRNEKTFGSASEETNRSELRGVSGFEALAAIEWRRPGFARQRLFEDYMGSYAKDFSKIFDVLERASGKKLHGKELFEFMTTLSLTALFRDLYEGSFDGVVADLLQENELLLAMFRYQMALNLEADYRDYKAYSDLAGRFIPQEDWYARFVREQIRKNGKRRFTVVVVGPSFGQELFFWAWILQKIKREPGFRNLDYEVVGYEKFEDMAAKARDRIEHRGLDLFDVTGNSRSFTPAQMSAAFDVLYQSRKNPHDFSGRMGIIVSPPESPKLKELVSRSAIVSFNNVWPWMSDSEKKAVVRALRQAAPQNPALAVTGVDVLAGEFQTLDMPVHYPKSRSELRTDFDEPVRKSTQDLEDPSSRLDDSSLRPSTYVLGRESIRNLDDSSSRSELRASLWEDAAAVYRDLDRLTGVEAIPGRGSAAQKKQKRNALLAKMILEFDQAAEVLRREMGAATVLSVYQNLGILFDQAADDLIEEWIRQADARSLRAVFEWNLTALQSRDGFQALPAMARAAKINDGLDRIRLPYIRAYQNAVGRKREAAHLMGIPPKTYDYRAEQLGIDFKKVSVPPGTLLARLVEGGQTTAQVRKGLYDILVSEKGGTTFNLVEFRKTLAQKPGFGFLKSPGFSYARLLWGLNLAEDFLYEAEDRQARHGNLMIRVGESFGFETPSAKANIERILAEIKEFRKRQPASGDGSVKSFDILRAIGKTREEVLKELNEELSWNLRQFVEAHPEISWVQTRGFDELVRLLGIEEEAKTRVEEAYRVNAGHIDYAAEFMGIKRTAYKKLAESLKVDFDKLEIPAGSLLKALNPENPGEKRGEILVWLESSGWNNLAQLKSKAFENHAYFEEKVFSVTDVLWGLDLAVEFAGRYRFWTEEQGVTSPNQIGMKFGWPKGSAKITLNSILNDKRFQPLLTRSELRDSETDLALLREPLKKPGAAMIDFRDLVTFTPEEIREAAIVISQRGDVRFIFHDVLPEHADWLRLKQVFSPFKNIVWTKRSGPEALRSLGRSFRKDGVTAFARRNRDLSIYEAGERKIIRFFAVMESRPGTFAAALSYDPEQRLFQAGVREEGGFYIIQPLLADLASRYLAEFAFAASA